MREFERVSGRTAIETKKRLGMSADRNAGGEARLQQPACDVGFLCWQFLKQTRRAMSDDRVSGVGTQEGGRPGFAEGEGLSGVDPRTATNSRLAFGRKGLCVL